MARRREQHPEQLSFDDLRLRAITADLSPSLHPKERWRILLRRVEPPPGSTCCTKLFRGVGSALATYANRSGVCWPHVETIAKDAGVSRRSAQRALAALEEASLIRRKVRGRAGASVYQLWMPPLRAVENPVDKPVDACGTDVENGAKG